MFAYLKGRIIHRWEEGLILETSGVGYELLCSTNTLDRLGDDGPYEFWVQTIVREDAITLFGFGSQVEKKMFQSLCLVTGVGPKLALKILSGASVERLGEMIDAGDVKALTALPKVGKKTAEQIVLTLKGKLVFADRNLSHAEVAARGADSKPGRADLASALVNLGFRPSEVDKVVAALPEDIDLQQGIRQGLQALAGH